MARRKSGVKRYDTLTILLHCFVVFFLAFFAWRFYFFLYVSLVLLRKMPYTYVITLPRTKLNASEYERVVQSSGF